MGADLLLLGFTVEGELDLDRGRAFITALSDDQVLDLTGDSQFAGGLDVDDAEAHRSMLEAGLVEAFEAFLGHRHSTSWPVSDRRWFVTAGGATWGDDPFDGWSSLGLFIDTVGRTDSTLPAVEGLRLSSNVVGAGICP